MKSYFAPKISLLLLCALSMQPLYGMQESLFNRFTQAISRYGSMPKQDIKALYTWGMKKRLGKSLSPQEKLAAVQAWKHARNIGITVGTVMAIIAAILIGKKTISYMQEKKRIKYEREQELLQEKKDKELITAAGEKRFPQNIIMPLLEEGANPNAMQNGITPLMAAASAGNYSNVVNLVDAGAEINKSGWYGYTALMKATKSGEERIFSVLIEHGADVNQTDNGGRTALFHVLSAHDQIEQEQLIKIIGLLADNGANLDVFALPYTQSSHYELLSNNEDFKLTPLMIAALKGSPEVAITLLQKGANANIATKNKKETALHIAVDRAKKYHSDEVSKPHLAVITALLKHGADLTKKDTHGKSPYDYMQTIPEMQKLLPEYKIQFLDIARKKEDPTHTPLARLDKDVWSVITGLIKADPSPPDPKKVLDLPIADTSPKTIKYPLIAAVKVGNITKVKKLLNNPKININEQDEDGDTALIVAARNKFKEIARLLLQKNGIIVLHTKSEDPVLQEKDQMVYTFIQQNPELKNILKQKYEALKKRAQREQQVGR